MKKILVLAVLILALSASMAMALPNPWTTYLTATDPITSSVYAVQLDASVAVVGPLWEYTYVLTNDAGASGYLDYVLPIDRFTINLDASMGTITPGVTPAGWVETISPVLASYDATLAADRLAIGASKTYSYFSTVGPSQVTVGAAIDGLAFNGKTLAPVPEASTLVGFGSALVMAGPGMIGWLRRRRA